MALWNEVDRVMAFHQKPIDRTPIHALNRIFLELVHGQLVVPSINPHKWQVRQEEFACEQLLTFVRKDTSTTNPRYTGDPIVVVEFQECVYVVDGRRRINELVSNRAAGRLSALVIRCAA